MLLAPALVLEVAIHLVPMAAGVWMSLLELTQYQIRDWGGAPFVGLDNYRVALDVDGAAGGRLLRSFAVTLVYAVLAVSLSWLLGTAGAICLQREFRGRAVLRTLFLTPYALPAYAASPISASASRARQACSLPISCPR